MMGDSAVGDREALLQNEVPNELLVNSQSWEATTSTEVQPPSGVVADRYLAESVEEERIVLYKRRWYVLLVYALVCATQGGKMFQQVIPSSEIKCEKDNPAEQSLTLNSCAMLCDLQLMFFFVCETLGMFFALLPDQIVKDNNLRCLPYPLLQSILWSKTPQRSRACHTKICTNRCYTSSCRSVDLLGTNCCFVLVRLRVDGPHHSLAVQLGPHSLPCGRPVLRLVDEDQGAACCYHCYGGPCGCWCWTAMYIFSPTSCYMAGSRGTGTERTCRTHSIRSGNASVRNVVSSGAKNNSDCHWDDIQWIRLCSTFPHWSFYGVNSSQQNKFYNLTGRSDRNQKRNHVLHVHDVWMVCFAVCSRPGVLS